VRRPAPCLLLGLIAGLMAAESLVAQSSADPVAQALSQGDLYFSKRKYQLALDAYHKADSLSHHSSAQSYLKMAAAELKLGDFPSALDDAKHAVKTAGNDKVLGVRSHLLRANLLTQMSGKPTDKKLKEAEGEIREALALNEASPIAHYDLGFVLLKQERDAEGIAELNKFLSMPGADSETATEARRLVANPMRARAPFAPEFSFTTQDKQDLSNAALRGKVVLIDFWATWCPPCRESVPSLRNVNKKYAGKPFQLVSISSDEDADAWKTFVKAQHMEWLQYLDLSGDVRHSFKVESYPTFIVMDKDGVIRFRQSGEGPATEGELEDAIAKYLKRDSDPKLAAAAAAESAATSNGVALKISSNASARSSLGENPSISSATPPARDDAKRDADSASFSGIEGGVVTGNTYKNAALEMTFQFPQNWHAAAAESLHALNERTEAAAKAAIAQQHPEFAGNPNLIISKTVFYASRKGEWDGQHVNIPSLRIGAAPSRMDSVNLERFQQMVTNMAATNGLKMLGESSEFRVNKHSFVRADFARNVGSISVYQSFVQTVAGDYLLTIEIYAYSPEELQQVAASLQSISITDSDN